MSTTGYFGPLAALSYGNGLALSVAYDQDYRPSTRTVTGGTTVQSLAYSFDDAGDLKTVNDNVDATRSQAFQYDALYRLTQAAGVYGTYAYGYDADNNRTSLPLSSPGNNYSATYAYAANSNQLQSVTEGTNVRSISYTAEGNTLQDNSGTGVVFGYAYDNDNRLVEALLNGGTQAGYTLNYLGQRVIKAAVTSGTTHFHYDRGGHLIAESDGSGNVLREYVYLGDTPVAFITPSGGIDIIHTDHLGTPQKMTDASQAVVWDGGASDPFMMSALPATPAMGLRFPGQYYDGETGLHYNYFRDYDPSLGRYTESDPIGLGGGVNTYAYSGNNPVDFLDPSGRGYRGATVGGIIGGILGGLGGEGAGAYPGAIEGALLGSELEDMLVSLHRLLSPPCDTGGSSGGNSGNSGGGNGNSGGNNGSSGGSGNSGGTADSGPPASAPVGSSRSPLEVESGTNQPTTIDNRPYSGHALDRMQGRGIPLSVVQDTVLNGQTAPGNDPGTTTFYSPQNNVTVVTDDGTGTVITVRKGPP